MNYRYAFAALFVAAIFLTSTTVGADVSPTRKLPGAPHGAASFIDKNHRLHEFVAKDLAGHAITDIPAALIGVMDGTGEWDESPPGEVPAFSAAIPDALRSQVALFYNEHTQWLIVPRGWVLHYSAEGADSTLVMTFVAPTGAKDGWMVVYDVPACVGCMYDAADGIIPRAHKGIDKMFESHTPEPALEPKPQSLDLISACTALLRYQPPSSPPVSAVVYLETDDSEMADIYVALPNSQSALIDLVTRDFLNAHASCGAE